MGAGIAASPHCAERRICRCSQLGPLKPEGPLKPALDPGSPAQASLSIQQLPPRRSQTDLLNCAARGFAGLSARPAWRWRPKSPSKTVRCSTALLGVTTLASRFALQVPKNPLSRVAREAITSSGASSRLAPKRTRKLSPIACRRRSDLWSPAAPFLPFLAAWGGWDRRPDHMSTMHPAPESGKRKIREEACG
jgi:hypothetical protein